MKCCMLIKIQKNNENDTCTELHKLVQFSTGVVFCHLQTNTDYDILYIRGEIMRFVLQRVTSAQVDVEGKTVGKIDRGYLLLVGVSNTDTKDIADKMIEKVARLRIFEDENGKTNLSSEQVGGEILVISQFTLYADCRKGNRPSFTDAGTPQMAEELYEYIVSRCRELFKKTETGIFGADMKVTLTNDGPFTVVLDSNEIVK